MPVQELTETREQAAPRVEAQRSERGYAGGRVDRGSENSTLKAAQYLGWFSLGLGAVEVLFPRTLARVIGARPRPFRTRVMGLREIGAGIGILKSSNPSGWMKARVAGDMVDLKNLASAYGRKDSSATRLTLATATVVGVTVADIVVASRLHRSSPGTDRVAIDGSMRVNRPPEDCYRFWLDFRNAPRFMKGLQSVDVKSDRISEWRMKPLAGIKVKWQSETVGDLEKKTITWHSLDGGDIDHSGEVRFETPPDGRGTVIRLFMQFAPTAIGTMGATKLIKTFSEFQLKEDLRRLKNLLEAGEIPTTDGQTSGRMEAAR